MIDISRFILNEITLWYKSSNRKPLLLRGARQVGKSYAVRSWAKKNFPENKIIEINLEEKPSFRELFQGDFDIHRIINQLELLTGATLTQDAPPFIFIDEIQFEPRAITALRYFHEKAPQIPIIAAGSLLDFVLDEVGLPVGRVDELSVYPICFLEFLYACNEDKIALFITNHDLFSPIPEEVHKKILLLLRTYFYIGGMPEAVREYLQRGSLIAAGEVHARLLSNYQADFPKYSKKGDWDALDAVFKSAPSIVGKVRANYSKFDSQLRTEKIKKALKLLFQARLITLVRSTNPESVPLEAYVQEKFFKIILLDIGLLHSSLGFDWRTISPNEDLSKIANGAFAEQFVGQELLCKYTRNNNSQLYYWYRQAKGSDAEVDYMISHNNKPAGIEVKSGKGGRLKSLNIMMKELKLENSFTFSQSNVRVDKNITYLPLYFACRL